MSEPTQVLSPCAGTVRSLSEVPDPVFSAEMVGPGVAIEPGAGRVTVVSPLDGTVVKVHPHAFVVLGEQGRGVLVHLGIDTNRLEGEGFEVHAQQGGTVAAGDPMVTWTPTDVADRGLSPVVPVVVMDAAKGSVTSARLGEAVEPGDDLFALP